MPLGDHTLLGVFHAPTVTLEGSREPWYTMTIQPTKYLEKTLLPQFLDYFFPSWDRPGDSSRRPGVSPASVPVVQ